MPETNISLKVDSSELDIKLSKSMYELGVQHDEYGRLVNKQKQFVAGLSQAAIKMGDYIDATGKMRNKNGQLMEGLSATQKKLRMWVDEFGRIHDASGKVVDSLYETDDLLKELADSSTKASVAFSSLSVISGPLSGVAQTLGNIQAQMNLFITATNEVKRVWSVFSVLQARIKATSGQQALLTTLTKNYVAVAASIGAVVGVTLNYIGNKIAENIVSQDGYIDALDKTAMAMAAVKNEGNNTQKALAAAGAKTNITLKDQADQLVKNIDILEDSIKSGEKWQARFTGAADAMIIGGTGIAAATGAETFGIGALIGAGVAGLGGISEVFAFKAKAKTEEAYEKLAEVQNQLAEQVTGLIEQDLPKKESVALNERLQAYNEYEKIIREKCNVEDENIVSILNQIEKAKEVVSTKIEEAKRKELDIDKDVVQYFEKSKDHTITYAETVEKIKEAAEKNNLSLEEQNKAIDRATESFKKNLGVDSMLESIKTPMEKYNEAVKKVTAAYEAGLITLEQKNKIEEKLKETTGLINDKKDEPEQDRKQELGVDSMLESIKTPMEQYRESLKKADQALQEGFITEEQCTKLKKKYAEETFSDVLGKLEETKSAQEKYNEEIQRAKDALREGVITANQCSELQKQYAKELYSQVFSVLEGTKTAQEKYNEVIKQATDAHKAGVITDREYAAIKKKTAQDMYSDVVSSLASMKTSQAKYEEATKRAEEARRAGVISEKEETALKKKYADDLKQQKMRSLGLNSLLDEIKTPMEKYKEQIQKVDEGLKDKLITADEAKKMKDLLYQKFFPEDFELDKSPDLKRVEDRAKEAPMAKSVTAGSQEMYSIIAGQNKDRVDKIENNLASFVDLFRDYSNKFDEFARDQGEVQFAMLS